MTGYSLYHEMTAIERSILMCMSEFGRTCPSFFMFSDEEALVMSLKLEARNSLIGIHHIVEAMDALCESQCHVPSVSDDARSHVEKAVPQCFQEFLFVHARQCQALEPVDNIVREHSGRQIGPVGMKLLTGESVQRKTIFCLFDKVLYGGPLKMKWDEFHRRLHPVGDDYMVIVFILSPEE